MPNDIAAVADALSESHTGEKLSPWWRRACLFTMALGFSVLILLTVKVYYEAPPIPAYTGGDLARLLEWCRMRGDLVFIVFGVVPIAIAAVRAYLDGRKTIQAAGVPVI